LGRGSLAQADLRKAYKQGSIDWSELEKRFKLQLRTAKESVLAINQLLELSKKRNITLLCYDKEGERCHRHVVKARIEYLSHRKNKGTS
jgi:uncharacterized protein YeaO (DUF488 family)